MQQLCQRRLRLANELDSVAGNYNKATSDRRLFINNITNQYNSGLDSVGGVTFDNIADNQQYDYISISNLYDNGYYVLDGDGMLEATEDDLTKPIYGSTLVTNTTKTGNSTNFTNNTTPYIVGNEFSQNGFIYKITAATSAPGSTTYNPANSTTGAQSPFGSPIYTAVDQVIPSGTVGITTTQGTASTIATTYDGSNNRIETISRTDTVTEIKSEMNSAPIKYVAPGSQTLAGATEVRDAAQLQAALSANQSIILMNDIDLSSLGTVSNYLVASYSGNIEGNGYTIKNLDITATPAGSYSPASGVGIIGAYTGSSIKNLSLDSVNVNVSNGSGDAGTLIGHMTGGAIDNVKVTNSTVTGGMYAGGLVGVQKAGSIAYSYSDANVSGNTYSAGGLAGVSAGNISYSFGAGNISTSGTAAGGLVGVLIAGGSIGFDYCYATGNVSNTGSGSAGGLIGAESDDTVTLNNCYATGVVSASSGNAGGLVGGPTLSTVINNSFWDIQTTGCSNAQGSGTPTITNTSGLTTAQIANDSTTSSYVGAGTPWDYSTSGAPALGSSASSFKKTEYTQEYRYQITTPPTVTSSIYTCTADEYEVTTEWVTDTSNIIGYQQKMKDSDDVSSEDLEAGLRSGRYSLATDADAMTQTVTTINGKNYEKVDWRTVAVINDDLYTANDAEAETRYQAATVQINSMDKDLQLEQAKVETEYKAITTEKEAVKKILDTNTTASFKYFS